MPQKIIPKNVALKSPSAVTGAIGPWTVEEIANGRHNAVAPA
jgi:hypothetical protein